MFSAAHEVGQRDAVQVLIDRVERAVPKRPGAALGRAAAIGRAAGKAGDGGQVAFRKAQDLAHAIVCRIPGEAIAAAAAAGADCFVAGSAVFGREDYGAEITALRELARAAV